MKKSAVDDEKAESVQKFSLVRMELGLSVGGHSRVTELPAAHSICPSIRRSVGRSASSVGNDAFS